MAIQLDGNQLRDFIKEQVRQVLTAHAELQDECGVTVIPRFKMRFSALVVANGGLNAVVRNSISATSGEKVSVSEEQPYVEKTSRQSTQTGRNTELNETSGTESQDVRSKETGDQRTTGSNQEEGSTGTSGSERSTSRTDGSTKEDTSGKEDQKSTQHQSQGTTQMTITDYSR